MSSRRKPVVSGLKPRQAAIAGMVMTAIGSYLLWEGYEASGRSRPWVMRLLPGP